MSTRTRTTYAFAPASVGNFGPFYDVAGFSLDHLGDIVEARPNDTINEVRLLEINGPYADELNATGISLQENNVQQVANWIWRQYASENTKGLDLFLHKYLPLRSGLGSSAASCAAAAKCVLVALGIEESLSQVAKVEAAMKGELHNNDFEHLDNILPSYFGGVWNVGDKQFYRVNSPEFTIVAFLDEAERKSTFIQRRLVKEHLRHLIEDPNQNQSIEKLLSYFRFFSHSSMLLIQALNDGNMETVGELINVECDNLLYEARGNSIPRLREMKETMMEAGAYGCSISGSGPAIFAIVPGKDGAKYLRDKVVERFSDRELKWLISPLNSYGSKVLRNIDDWYQANRGYHNFW